MEAFIAVLIVIMLVLLFGGAVAVGLGYLLMGIYGIIVGICKGIAQILK